MTSYLDYLKKSDYSNSVKRQYLSKYADNTAPRVIPKVERIPNPNAKKPCNACHMNYYSVDMIGDKQCITCYNYKMKNGRYRIYNRWNKRNK